MAENKTVFVGGLYFNKKPEKAPDFILGKLKINPKELSLFLANYANEEWIYADVKMPKDTSKSPYVALSEWKPNINQQRAKEIKEVVQKVQIEYPTEEINPEDIPFN